MDLIRSFRICHLTHLERNRSNSSVCVCVLSRAAGSTEMNSLTHCAYETMMNVTNREREKVWACLVQLFRLIDRDQTTPRDHR